jgi:glycosyltransferase involved in cell wall biosynthesis
MPYGGDLQRHGVEVCAGIAEARLNLAGIVRLIRALRETRPDVLLISSNRQAMILGAVASHWCRIPITLVYTHEHQGRAATTLRRMAQLSDGIVAAADHHRAYLRSVMRLPPGRIVRVYPGINFDRTTFNGPAQVVASAPDCCGATVGIIAALRPEKDHETFLRAAAIIAAQMPETRFLVIGDGQRRSYLEELARDFRLSTHIRFLGWQPVDASLMRRLDVLALSSLSETFPAVILEAFSAGVPVVATDVGSVAELFGVPPCGVLVPSRDPAALAQALIALLHDRTRAQQIVGAAARRVHYFSADRFCRDMLLLAQRVAAAKDHASAVDISQILEQDAANGQSV